VSPDLFSVPQERDDAELVRRTTRGELSAFEQLVDRHKPVVVRVAARIVGSEEAEDVSQDAFLRAFHRLDRFRGDAPFRSWLLRITHNAALDHLGRHHPEPVDPETLDTSEQARRARRLSASRCANGSSAWSASCTASRLSTEWFSCCAMRRA
jgi:RNA polymerase sigma factor (sigma-70 family)